MKKLKPSSGKIVHVPYASITVGENAYSSNRKENTENLDASAQAAIDLWPPQSGDRDYETLVNKAWSLYESVHNVAAHTAEVRKQVAFLADYGTPGKPLVDLMAAYRVSTYDLTAAEYVKQSLRLLLKQGCEHTEAWRVHIARLADCDFYAADEEPTRAAQWACWWSCIAAAAGMTLQAHLDEARS